MSGLRKRKDMHMKDTDKCCSIKRNSTSNVTGKIKKLKTRATETDLANTSFSSKVLEEVVHKVSKCLKSEKVLKTTTKTKGDNPKEEAQRKMHEVENSTKFAKQKWTDLTESNVGLKKTADITFALELCNWKDEDCLADIEKIPVPDAKNIINLFNEDNTIPFIARYRNHLTGNLKPEKLRKVKETYQYIQEVHEKAKKLHRQLLAANALTPALLSFIQTARTIEELDFIGLQFKKGSKRTLAERAKQLGLQLPAENILEGKQIINLESLVEANVAELNDVKKVKQGIQHIIADVISKTPEVHSEMEKIYSSKQISLRSELKEKNEEEKILSKYKLYEDFSLPLHAIKPHQILAINRGESENKLLVKIVIPSSLWLPLKRFCKAKWLHSGMQYDLRTKLLSDSVNDAVKRLLEPLAVRRMRAKLRTEAESEALCIFAWNLQHLLMTPPCSGRVVMGVDPGFAMGCKVAVVSHAGDILGHDKFFLRDPSTAREKLKNLISKFRCDTIALGNGRACRETEALLSKFITRGYFKPFDVSYTIVSEQGLSIYSCSPIAAEEFPHLEPSVIGAVSLARRLQNPLSELVKVEPKHLGVGMYQHDMREKKLEGILEEIVTECVSFVGVDVNSASVHLLKRVAGLNTSKAQEIIKYRTEICSFKQRDDLKKVKGIKEKTFRQCAGFLRVIPSTARCTRHKSCHSKNLFNPLDETSIHPESYDTAHRIMNFFGVTLDQLGSGRFMETVKNFEFSIEKLAKYCECSDLVVSFIIDTLTKPKNFDMRSLSAGLIFRREIKTLEEVLPGQILEGVVRNVVSFGAFVDVGVGVDGLIHVSETRNVILHLNNRVIVKVNSLDKSSRRIQLKLISLIE